MGVPSGISLIHPRLARQVVAHDHLHVLRTRTFDSKDTRSPPHEQSTRPILLHTRIEGMDCSFEVLQGGLVVDLGD